jgi:hypothetical protein
MMDFCRNIFFACGSLIFKMMDGKRHANGAPVFRAVMPPAIRTQAAPPWVSRPVHFRQASLQPSSQSLHLHFSLFPIPAAYGSRNRAMPRLFGYAAPQVKESAVKGSIHSNDNEGKPFIPLPSRRRRP